MRYNIFMKTGMTLCLLFFHTLVQADILEDFRSIFKSEQDNFRKQANAEINEYRRKAHMEYTELLSKPWTPFPQEAKIQPPVNPDPPRPLVIKDEDKIPIDNPLPIDTIVLTPVPKPQPKPIYPIDEVPNQEIPDVNITFYGTPLKIRGATFKNFKLDSTDEKNVSEVLKALLDVGNDNFILDCLRLREELGLPDWGYFQMVDKALSVYEPSGSDTHALFLSYVIAQSGYAVRLCRDVDKKLHLFIGGDCIMYNRTYIKVDGTTFFCYDEVPDGKIYTIASSKKEGRLFSMALPVSPNFTFSAGNKRILSVHNHPELTLHCTPNKNLIDFFNNYPKGTLSQNIYSKWAIHGNTPMSKEIKNAIYPVLKNAVSGLSQSDAVNLLLKVAQSFEYEHDNDIWGEDRAFWAEESWHYPYSDCEDHAINFTRLVRDILDLDAVLIYYPKHLSSAIAITDGSQCGDYVLHSEKKYYVCDATYFFAPAGVTAPENDNSSAILIPLIR